MLRAHRLRVPVAIVAATTGALLLAAPAFAHIDPDPAAVEAGKEATVGFTVEHGCGESPTTKVEIELPDGSTGAEGIEVGGFTASVDGQVVTFSGATLPSDEEMTFEVRFTVPDQPGDVPVKIVQTCEEGSLDWIEVQADGEPEPEHPAPVLTITEGAPTGEQDGKDHGHEEGTTSTTAADQGDGVAAEPEGDSSSTGPIVAGVAVAAVVIGGGAFLIARSRKDGGDDGPAAPVAND